MLRHGQGQPEEPGRQKHGQGQGPAGRGPAPFPGVLGVHTVWTTVGDGEFYCPRCGGDRNYERRDGRRFFALFGIPMFPRGADGTVIECTACTVHHPVTVLEQPTTQRLTALLGEAVRSVVLATLAAGRRGTRALAVAERAMREAGHEDCGAAELTALVELRSGEGPGRPAGYPGLAAELHETLAPLAPCLAAPGRESLLLQGARIALADGPYSQSERDVLAAVGHALTLPSEDVERLLRAARTPSS